MYDKFMKLVNVPQIIFCSIPSLYNWNAEDFLTFVIDGVYEALSLEELQRKGNCYD